MSQAGEFEAVMCVRCGQRETTRFTPICDECREDWRNGGPLEKPMVGEADMSRKRRPGIRLGTLQGQRLRGRVREAARNTVRRALGREPTCSVEGCGDERPHYHREDADWGEYKVYTDGK